VIDDQDVSQDWLRRGDVVAAITSHPGPLQGCDTIPLGSLRYRATASPTYIARWFPNGLTEMTLSHAPALTFSEHDRLQDRWVTHFVSPRRRPVFPTHRLASSQGFVDACRAGLGWALNPEPLIQRDLQAGTLVELVPETPLDVGLYWQFTRLGAPALAPVTRAVRASAGRSLLPP
jgi:LysR family transcriptional regulator, chromosome initiation inhibitor